MGISCTKHLSCLHVGTSFNNISPRLWEDLPRDILPLIADKLCLIDLLSFRGVCKSWRASSSLATAQVESSPGRHPWCLLYRDKSPCFLLNDKDKSYYINIPELEGTTCISSYHGWLLLFKRGSIFFFCPFSRSRIDLPKLPISRLSDHIAAVSSPPTSKDCIVCILIRYKDSKRLDIMTLSRGEYQWQRTKHELRMGFRNLSNITCAIFYNEVFYFWDDGTRIEGFRPRDKKLTSYTVRKPEELVPGCQTIPFDRYNCYTKDWKKHTKEWLGFEGDFSVSTCGTLLTRPGKHDLWIANETMNPGLVPDDTSRVKGVWLHPRFFQVSKHKTW